MSVILRIRRRLHDYGRRLLAAHASPGRLAAACLVGAIVGCTPLFGLHLPICIAIAWLLRLNQVTVYAAANISIPPAVPLIGLCSVEIGERLLHGRFIALSLADFRGQGAHAIAARFFVDWLAGGAVVGAGVGAVMAAIVYTIARRRRLADPVTRAIREASARYRGTPPSMRHYAWWKYRLDPCYRRIAPLLPDATLTVDLGTGLGMLPLVVALLPGERRVIGIDWDKDKLAAGRTAAAGLERVELREGDVRASEIPPCDAITIVDVLHYYAADAQREILERCARSLRPGGQLLVREGDARAKSGAWTRFLEGVAVRIGWNRGEGSKNRFRPIAEIEADLRALGFAVESDAAAGRLHPGNRLIRATK